MWRPSASKGSRLCLITCRESLLPWASPHPFHTKVVLKQFCLKYWGQLVPTTLTFLIFLLMSAYIHLFYPVLSLVLFVHRLIHSSCRFSFSASCVSGIFSALEYSKNSGPLVSRVWRWRESLLNRLLEIFSVPSGTPVVVNKLLCIKKLFVELTHSGFNSNLPLSWGDKSLTANFSRGYSSFDTQSQKVRSALYIIPNVTLRPLIAHSCGHFCSFEDVDYHKQSICFSFFTTYQIPQNSAAFIDNLVSGSKSFFFFFPFHHSGCQDLPWLRWITIWISASECLDLLIDSPGRQSIHSFSAVVSKQ